MILGSQEITESEKAHGSPRWWRYLSYVLLGMSIVATAAFFLSYWLVNAEIGDRYYIGLALTMAIASVLAFYASLIMAGIDFLVTLIAMVARMRSRLVWAAVAVALFPLGWAVVFG